MEIKDILYIKSKLTKGIINEIILIYEPKEFLKLLNMYVKENIGLFCLSDNVLKNYERILKYLSEFDLECRKDYFESYAIIMLFQNLKEEEKEKLGHDYLEKEKEEHGLNHITVKKLFEILDYDWLVYRNYLHDLTYYDNSGCEEYVKSSFTYFKNQDKKNILSYNKIIEKYKNEKIVFLEPTPIINLPIQNTNTISFTNAEIIKFPKKKLLQKIFKK